MNKLALLFSAAALGCTAAIAGGGHLIPNDPPLAKTSIDRAYEDVLSAKFGDLERAEVRVHVLIISSTGPERGIGIAYKYHVYPTKPDYYVETLAATEKIGQLLFLAREQGVDLAAAVRPVSVERCERPLPRLLAERLIDAWKRTVLGTRYDPEDPLPDNETIVLVEGGTTYHYSAIVNTGHVVQGRSPAFDEGILNNDPNESPALLQGLVEMLTKYCNHGGDDASANLADQVTALEKKLNSP
jgi:hypothetical protein